jgi:hypothetical protein
VCGAPARVALASPKTFWWGESEGRNELVFGSKRQTEVMADELEEHPERGEITEIGFAKEARFLYCSDRCRLPLRRLPACLSDRNPECVHSLHPGRPDPPGSDRPSRALGQATSASGNSLDAYWGNRRTGRSTARGNSSSSARAIPSRPSSRPAGSSRDSMLPAPSLCAWTVESSARPVLLWWRTSTLDTLEEGPGVQPAPSITTRTLNGTCRSPTRAPSAAPAPPPSGGSPSCRSTP